MKKIFFATLLIIFVIFAGNVFAKALDSASSSLSSENSQPTPVPTKQTDSASPQLLDSASGSAEATNSGQVPVAVPMGSTITVNPEETQPIKVEGQSAVSGGPVPAIVTQVTISETPQEIKISFDKEAKETQISVAGTTVSTTQPVQVEQSKLYMETSVGPQEIKISPTEASGKVPQAIKVQDITLEESLEAPIYRVSGAREAKILFFIPVSVPVETQVNAQTGEVVSVQKPWWNFLAW